MGITVRAARLPGPLRRAVLVLAIAAAAGACAPGQASRGHASATHATAAASRSAPPATAPPTGPVGTLCSFPDAPGRLTTIKATDGVRLAAIQAGSGPRGVVLIPELGNEGKCGWWPYAASLAAHGFNVVAIDHRC